MTPLFWLKILIYVLCLIATGIPETDALSEASSRFLVSVSEIVNRLT